MLSLCSPALIYLIFSSTQIIIDFYKGMVNNAIMKIIITIFVTILLHILCIRGFSLVSWLIVFIPFILMSVVVGMLFYSGLNKSNEDKQPLITDKDGNIVIYDPNYMLLNPPFYYKYPNLIVTNPKTPIAPPQTHSPPPPPPYGTSPEYQS